MVIHHTFIPLALIGDQETIDIADDEVIICLRAKSHPEHPACYRVAVQRRKESPIRLIS